MRRDPHPDPSGAIYALPINDHGYLGTHHSKVAKPMTGDYAIDLLSSRHMRILSSASASRPL